MVVNTTDFVIATALVQLLFFTDVGTDNIYQCEYTKLK